MKPFYQMSPTTARKAESLARVYGYEGVETLAASVAGTTVVDYGAGNSNLGQKVVELCPDMQWLNVDLRYGKRGLHRCRQRRSAPGLQYLAGDVLHNCLQPGTVDRIFSSAMLSHIRATSEGAAYDAFHGMAQTLKDGGEMSIIRFLPIKKLSSEVLPSYVLHLTAEQYRADPDGVAAQAVGHVEADMMSLSDRALNVAGYYLGANILERWMP